MAGESAVTIREVAALAGTSVATAARAVGGYGSVAGKTREAVLDAAKTLNFQPNLSAQRLVQGRVSNVIGIFSLVLDLGVGTRKLRLVQAQLGKRGFHTPIYASMGNLTSNEQQIEMVRTLCRQKYRALVCASSYGLHPEALAELENYAKNGGIVVGYSYSNPLPVPCDQVVFDTRGALQKAAKNLLKQGHRDIGYFFSGAPGFHTSPHLEGFLKALHEAGLRPEPSWLFPSQGYDQHELEGEYLAAQFLALPPARRPTGLCIVNDTAAAAFVTTISRAGVRVPRDVSVVGMDDKPIARLCTPPLSTISHPVEAITGCVVQMLCQRLDGIYDGPPRVKTMRGNLIERQSVAQPAR